MAEISNDDLQKWFDEQYFTNNPQQRANYDGLDDAGKEEFRNRVMEEERIRRNNEEVITETVTRTEERNGYTSDEWEQLFTGDNTRFLHEKDFLRGVDITILDEMGKLPSNFSSLSNDEKADTISRLKTELTPEERQTFNESENEARKRILEVYPPKRLVETDEWLDEAQTNTEDDALKQRIQNSRQVIMETMENKIHAYANGEIVVDQSNIADVYDGANRMFDYVEKRSEKENIKDDLATSRKKLEEQINIYDENNGFTDLSESNSAEIYQAYQRATKSSENTQNPPEEYADLWNNIEFSDESQRDENIALFNEAAMKQAIRNVAVKNKDTKGKKLDEALKDELHKVYTEQLGALIIANEMQKNCTNPKYTPDMAKTDMKRVIADLQAGKKYKLDNKSLVGNFANYTNDNMGYLNRLGTKIGEKAPVLGSMYNAVKKFDDTCIKRFNPLYGQIRSFERVVAGNMARQALNQAVRWGTQLIPGGNIVYGSYVAGQAIWRLGTKYKREKEEAKKNGKKFSGWGFLKNNVGEIASSAMLAVGSFIPGGNQALAFGASVLAIGTNAIKTFRRSREQGESGWKALSKTLTSVGTSLVSATVSSFLLGKAIDASGLDDFAANYFAKTVPAGEFDPNNPRYSQDPVTDPARIEELKGLADKDLAEKGYIFEHTTKDAEGAFLISEGKDGFTTHDYSQEELKFAEMRNDGIRYSEYLNKQWVHEDYQDPNSTNPLDHSEVAHDNAIKSLNKLAESHTEMSTYQDGQLVSNSEMLLYKLYQANVLAPNPDALSDSGLPIGEVLGATDANGNLVTHQDVFQKVLHGQELNETDYKVICNIEDRVGGQLTFDENGNRILNDMGKIKDFDTLGQGGNPDSYNVVADKGYEVNTNGEQEEQYGRFIETVYDRLGDNVWGVVFDNQERGKQTELRKRIGANGKTATIIQETQKRIQKRKEKKKEEENIIPIPVIEEEKEEIQEDHKRGYGKLLADEYKIMYGVEPKVVDSDKPNEHKQYQHWINYNNRVDEERKATGRDIDMYDFLTERREKFDEIFNGLSNEHYTTFGSQVKIENGEPVMDKYGHEVTVPVQIRTKDDYEKHSDTPGTAVIVAQARESVMKSNITTENYLGKMTLSHFTDYAKHYVDSDEYVGAGTRDIRKNPSFKRPCFRKGEESTSELNNSEYKVMDLNGYYFDDAGPNASGARKEFHPVKAVDNGLQLALYEIRDNHYPEEHNKENFLKTLERREKAAMERRKNRSR